MSRKATPQSELPVQLTKPASRSTDEVREMLRPPMSVADLGPDCHVRVYMHPDVGWACRELGSRRAPTEDSEFRHKVGVGCEVAACTRFGVQVNQKVHPRFEGDDGYDMMIPRPGNSGYSRAEVRGTTKWDNPERKITADEIDDADIFILCRTRNPEDYVEIVGSASRLQVKYLGQMYGEDGFCLRPDYLSPLGPKRISRDDVKETNKELLQAD